jgi:membrane-associated phospholipid phosphatase
VEGSVRARAGLRGLLAVQRAAARVALGTAGALVDRPRRPAWLEATVSVLTAHGARVVLERVSRRARPPHPDLVVHVRVGPCSLPSSHAASTTALALGAATAGARARWSSQRTST